MIEIDYPNEGKIFCPACGTLTLGFGESGREFEMNECPHLEFLGTDEGPEFDRNKWYTQWEAKDPKRSTHYMEYLAKTLDGDYVCFTQRTPPPGMLSGFTIFKILLD